MRLNLDREDTFGLCCQTALGAPAGALLFRRVTASLAKTSHGTTIGVLAFGFRPLLCTGIDFSQTLEKKKKRKKKKKKKPHMSEI